MPPRNLMFATYSPRLRFLDEPDPVGGTGDPKVDTPPELGFPANTSTSEMTDKEQAAYWKHHSRKHEATAIARADYDALKADSVELSQLRTANQSVQDKALSEARAEGAVTGANRYLMEAVHGRLMALTGKTDDELGAALDLIDVTRLTQADGGLDLVKLNAFAVSLGTKEAPQVEVPPTDPVKEALERQKNGASNRGPGSIAELTKQRVAALTPTK